jgi:hypothetical protein
MKLTAEIIDKDAHREFGRFLKATGTENWERKIAKLKSLPKFRSPSPNVYSAYLASKNPLLEAVARYLSLEKEGKSLRKNAGPALMKVSGYLKVINAVVHRGGTATLQKVRSLVLDDETVRSFLFELDIAINYFHRGYDVQFVDLQDLGTYDLLVSEGQTELEIECKTKSADAGRKITRRNFYLLCDVLAADLAPLTKSFALLFKTDGRLSGSQELFHSVSEEIKQCRNAGRDNGQVENLRFEILNLSPGFQVKTNEEAAIALAPHWSPDAHYFVLSNVETLIVGCESTDKNRVLKAIYEDLKRGAGQLSKTRPSMLACQLEEIDDEDWTKLRGESGLAAMTARLLGNPERNHINFVVYSSDQTAPRIEGAITSFSATNLRFGNKNAKYVLPESFFGSVGS